MDNRPTELLKRSRRGAVLLGAVGVHGIVLASLYAIAERTYGGGATLPEGPVLPLTLVALGLGGAAGLLLGVWATYLYALEAKPWVATLTTALVCAPCVFLSCTWLYACWIFSGLG